MNDKELIEHIKRYANSIVALPSGGKNYTWWEGLKTGVNLVLVEIKECERRQQHQ